MDCRVMNCSKTLGTLEPHTAELRTAAPHTSMKEAFR